MKLDIMVVDDEQPAIDQLTELIVQSMPIDRLRTYTNSIEAWQQLQIDSPDLVFLDIEMPGLNGMTFAERIFQENLKSRVVFVTAYHQYAINAFEHNALDYLLKPVRPERFLKTLQKIMQPPIYEKRPQASIAQQQGYISCFGSLEVTGPLGQVQWLTAKAEELFAYLLVHKQVKLDHIIDDVFSDSTLERAKWNVHTTLYRIRNSLRDAGLEEQISIQYKNRKYVFELQDVIVDLDDFFASTDPHKLLELFQDDLFGAMDALWTHTVHANVLQHLFDQLEKAIQQAEKAGDQEEFEYFQRFWNDLQN